MAGYVLLLLEYNHVKIFIKETLMKNILLLILFLNVAMYAQVVTVKDKATQNPLELVSVYNSDPNRALLTGSNGKVDIGKLDKSKPIIFRLIGYERIELTISQIEENNFIVLMNQTTISLMLL